MVWGQLKQDCINMNNTFSISSSVVTRETFCMNLIPSMHKKPKWVSYFH
jgi:hypothetical protein